MSEIDSKSMTAQKVANSQEMSSPEPAVAHKRSQAQRDNQFLAWNRSDRPFFAAGGCHILAFRFVERWPEAGLHVVSIAPTSGSSGTHAYVSDGTWAFDFNGWSPAEQLWDVNRIAMTGLDAAWDGKRRVIVGDLAQFCAAGPYRAPDQFAGDAVARADRYLDEWANNGQPPTSDVDQRRLRSFRRGPIAAFSLVALDCPDPKALAEFYISFAGGRIKNESPAHRWVRVRMPGGVDLGFQGDPDYVAPDWPNGGPQQAHLDFDVSDLDKAEAALLRIGALKAEEQPSPDDWRVMLDPAGHPFCIVLVP